MITKEEKEFLKESNAIESVYDDDSLNQAEYAWEYLKKQESLTPSVVLKTHKILMLHQKLAPYNRGYFRTEEVRIGWKSGMSYRKIPKAIDEWCKATMDSGGVMFGKKLHMTPKELHIWYEEIHPFIDGNGRTGRMFLNWTRLKLTKEPLLIIHEGEEQDEYYTWFK